VLITKPAVSHAPELVLSTFNPHNLPLNVILPSQVRYSILVLTIILGMIKDTGIARPRALVGVKIFSSPRFPHQFWNPASLSKKVLGILSPEVKRPGHEADHSPPT
jgi:hypothetical protein